MKDLKSINFHDLEVDDLDINVAKKSITLKTSIFNESTNDFNDIEVIFKGLSRLNFDNIFSNSNYFIEEINSFKLMENDGLFTAEFVFLQGFSNPSCELCFDFVDYVINR